MKVCHLLPCHSKPFVSGTLNFKKICWDFLHTFQSHWSPKLSRYQHFSAFSATCYAKESLTGLKQYVVKYPFENSISVDTAVLPIHNANLICSSLCLQMSRATCCEMQRQRCCSLSVWRSHWRELMLLHSSRLRALGYLLSIHSYHFPTLVCVLSIKQTCLCDCAEQ